MHIIGNEKLVKFQRKHSNVKSSLDHWTKLIEEGNFRSVVELRQKFPHQISFQYVLASSLRETKGQN